MLVAVGVAVVLAGETLVNSVAHVDDPLTGSLLTQAARMLAIALIFVESTAALLTVPGLVPDRIFASASTVLNALPSPVRLLLLPANVGVAL